MSEACAGGSDPARRKAGGLGAADWLSLAAAPSFAVMALLTAVPGGDALKMLCGPVNGVAGLGGMAPMYLLMSAFHSAPWLKLIAPPRRSQIRQEASDVKCSLQRPGESLPVIERE